MILPAFQLNEFDSLFLTITQNTDTAISKKVVILIVSSRYWNQKELWGSSSSKYLLLLAFTLQNIECRFLIMPRPYSNNLRWRVITHYGCTQSSSIDY